MPGTHLRSLNCCETGRCVQPTVAISATNKKRFILVISKRNPVWSTPVKDSPDGANSGLLIAHFQVAPDEEILQFAMVPHFA